MLSADNFCKQFGPRSNLFDIHLEFLKEFFDKVDFEKKSADNKKLFIYKLKVIEGCVYLTCE